MRITFVLPGPGYKPSGGFLVVYEYANRLASRGHDVSIIHAPPFLSGSRSFLSHVRKQMHYVARKGGLFKGFRPDAWFRVDPCIRLYWQPSLEQRWIPDGDVVIATAWPTAEYVNAYSGSKGRKFYFIQDYEKYFPSSIPERVDATWRMPLKKIVTAKWLAKIADQFGEEATIIPCGLDFKAFGIDIPIEERNPCHVAMLYHENTRKGSKLGITALDSLHADIPELQVTLFGVFPRPADLPEWMEYCHLPSRMQLRELYNNVAIFISPSLVEGWGLPCCEAAQCGAALCVTDVGGHREYAIPFETALLCPPGDHNALKEAVRALLVNNELRISLAKNANDYMRRFNWETSVNAFEKILEQ